MNQTSFIAMEILKKHMDVAAEELKVSKSDIEVISQNVFDYNTLGRKIKKLPFTYEHPVITAYGVSAYPFYSILYDFGINYISMGFMVGSDGYYYILVPRGRLHKLLKRCRKESSNSKELPIMTKDLQDNLYKNIIQYIKIHHKYKNKCKRGILLYGPPGNGKSMICRWIQTMAHKRNISYSNLSASGIISAFGNNSLEYSINKNTIIFMDDIDISFFDRSSNRSEISCALLSAMDGLKERETCVRIITTNESLENIDSAFRRPGRIDKAFYIGKPKFNERLEFINSWPYNISNIYEANQLANLTDDFSFAELNSIKNYLITFQELGDEIPTIDEIIKMCRDLTFDRKTIGF